MTLRKAVAVALAASLVAVAAVAGASHDSLAAWTDEEWIASTGQALDCSAPGVGTATASGTMLGGELLGLDLGTLAEVRGLVVANDGASASPDPLSADEVLGSGGEAWRNPLEVSAAFGAINLDLGGVLVLPLDTDTGVWHQYARADDAAGSTGAAGAVTDSGGIALDAFSGPADARPDFGSLELGTVLSAALGEPLADSVSSELTDLRLELGALAAIAELDGCAAAWSDELYAELSRDYAVAGLDLGLESALTGQLVTEVESSLGALEAAVVGLAGDTGLTSALASGILGSLGGVLGSLTLGTPTASLAVGVDFSAVEALLDDTISDDAGIVALDLAAGTLEVDLAALVGEAYGSEGLNGLGPNTELLIDAPVLTALGDAVAAALADWALDVVAEIDAALEVVEVAVQLSVPASVLGIALGNLTIEIEGGLDELLAGSGTVDASLGLGSCGILCGTVSGIVSGVLTGVEGSIATLGPVVGGLVETAVQTATGPLVTGLESALAATGASLVSLLDDTLGGLFGTDGLLSVIVNAQNDPDPGDAEASAEPSAWSAIPGAPSSPPYDSGRYDVAALLISVVGALETVELALARASVGGNVVG